MTKTRIGVLLLLVVGFLLVTPSPAYAYLDPGTGSFILQVVLGAVFAAILTVKTYWRKLRSVFRRPRARTDSAPPQ